MMLDQPQQCFGWSDMAPINQVVQHNSMVFDNIPTSNDMLSMWLEPRTDTESNHGSLDLMREGHFPLMNDSNMIVTADPQPRQLFDSGWTSGDNIPNERFAKVQRCWFAPPNYIGRIMNNLWRDIVHTNVESLFCVPSLFLDNESDLLQGRCGIDEDCRRRLQAAFSQSFTYPRPHSPRNAGASSSASGSASSVFPHFPPAEILDMSLDLFLRTFHPLVSFVHLPTFSARRTRLPLLYVMCLIGMMLLGTKGTTNFVSKNFTVSSLLLSTEDVEC